MLSDDTTSNYYVTVDYNLYSSIHRQQIHLRENHSKKSVEEKLGLPRKPKQPLSGYVRFITENIASVNETNPNLLKKEQIALLAKMWSTIGDARKEEYSKAHRDEKLDYRAKLIEYKRTLSEDDKKRVQELKTAILVRKAQLNKSKQRQELGKPKRPINKFVKFFLEQKRGEGKQTRQEYKNYYQEIASRWKGLSDAERAKYQTSPAELEAYQ